MRILPFLLAFLAFCAAPAIAQEVLIYRCVGAKGQVTLRDSPCAKGEQQETRSMQRPKAPPPATTAPATAAPAAAVPAAPPTTRVVYLSPPRPMYECTTPEGERYSSDSAEGNLRWVPYWTSYYPGWPYHGGGSISGHVNIGNGQLSFHSGSPTPLPPNRPPPPRPPVAGTVVMPAGGVWVRDECHALPQADICAQLSDRRYEILRRYGSAMPSERQALDREQRDIDARMANDCRNP